MKCSEDVLRNGYWTGRRCSRQATKRVTIAPGTDFEKVRDCCTQHAKNLVARHWVETKMEDLP